MNEKEKGKMASRIISNWKENEEVRQKHDDNFSVYAFKEEIKCEWERPEVREEFQHDYDAFFHFKFNEHRTNIIGNRVIR